MKIKDRETKNSGTITNNNLPTFDTMIDVEICINSDSSQGIIDSVGAATIGGASRIELCRAMHLDGLTPLASHIAEAANIVGDKLELLVMIRPRGGNFTYTDHEIATMQKQIKIAADHGANGVVLGVLKKEDSSLDIDSLSTLMKICTSNNLKVTFHRAFDAIPDPTKALEILIDNGVDRILTSGTVWGQKGTAIEGISKIEQLVDQAKERIEIVIGGGINSGNAGIVISSFLLNKNNISLHAYSGAQENGITTKVKVQELVKVAK